MKQYPQTGDIIWLDFDPQSGVEIKKMRPALAVSCNFFNEKIGLTMVCPITSTQKDFPLHVALDSRTETHGDILCEQLKSLDYHARSWKFIERAPDDIVDCVLEIIGDIIGR